MSFVIKDDDVPNKYNEIQDQIKEKLNIKFHSMPIFDEKYIKAKIREFNGEFITNFQLMKYQIKACITLAWPETGKKESPTSLFRKMQIQIKENKDNQIYKH